MKKLLSILFLLSIVWSSNAQDKAHAQEILKYLCSPELQGRGYVGDGNRKAAEYIAKAFQEAGLQPLDKDYFQLFSYPANSFPGKTDLLVNSRKLAPGKDFLISENSPSVKGKFQVIQISNQELLDPKKLSQLVKSATGKFVVLEAYQPKDYSKEDQKAISQIRQALQMQSGLPISGVVELTESKLTWSSADYLAPRPKITILKSAFSSEIKELKIDIENQWIDKFQTQNVIGKLSGKRADSTIVVTAHYDHLGMMGTALFPGASDNASGVAMLISLAQYFSENQPEFDMVFIAFSGEEIGLKGSIHYVENPIFPLSKIKFLLNLDISGTGDDGIQVVNGSIYKDQFERLQQLNDSLSLLKEVKIRGEACNSDHCFFHNKGVPSFFIYTLGGTTAYHDIYDTAEALPLTEFDDYFKLLTLFLEGF